MNRTLVSVLIILSAVFFLSSCTTTYESQDDYFNGDVLVQYRQTTLRGQDDTLTLTFYAPGTYTVEFSYTSGKENNRFNTMDGADLPEDFTFTVEDTPRVKVISQYILPGFLDVSIVRDDVEETHSFK